MKLTFQQIKNKAIPGLTVIRGPRGKIETFQGFSSRGLLLTCFKTKHGDLIRHWEEKDIKNLEMYLPN